MILSLFPIVYVAHPTIIESTFVKTITGSSRTSMNHSL